MMFCLILLQVFFSIISLSTASPIFQDPIVKLKDKIDSVKVETTWLKLENARLWNEISSFDEYCKIDAKGKCGPCRCRDNYKLAKKYYCSCQLLTPARDCKEHYQNGAKINGVYNIHANNLKVMQVFCDMSTDAGGWTVIQRRRDGSENFYRNWEQYKNGFGDTNNEFWLGNDNMHYVYLQSAPSGSELRIDMKDWTGNSKYAKYASVQFGNEMTNYILHINGYSGNAGDSLSSLHHQQPFSTFDKDHDKKPTDNCAQIYHGAWWYSHCHDANLNGKYFFYKEMANKPKELWATGIHWISYSTHYDSLAFVEMKVRRK